MSLNERLLIAAAQAALAAIPRTTGRAARGRDPLDRVVVARASPRVQADPTPAMPGGGVPCRAAVDARHPVASALP